MSVTTEGATRRVTMSQVYVTGLACAMASVRQMSQVWHVMRQMSQVWHVSWRLCVRCHGVRASDVMSRNVKTAAVKRGKSVTTSTRLPYLIIIRLCVLMAVVCLVVSFSVQKEGCLLSFSALNL